MKTNELGSVFLLIIGQQKSNTLQQSVVTTGKVKKISPKLKLLVNFWNQAVKATGQKTLSRNITHNKN